MTVGDVATDRPIGSGSIEIARQIPFTSAFLAVTNIAVAFCKCLHRLLLQYQYPLTAA